jgi:hypothetical protein
VVDLGLHGVRQLFVGLLGWVFECFAWLIRGAAFV